MRHHCLVCSYDALKQTINARPGPSPEITIGEHGWFRNVDVFKQIIKNYPVPSGESPEDVFVNWRDGLLEFLDTHHGGVRGQWTRVN
jgi:hypothetical protein